MKIWKRLVACFTMAMLLFTPITVMRASASDTSKSITVTYGQTEARSMLDLINDFRTSDEAWIWDTNDQDVIKYDNLSNLTYDPILEKVAMQRAAEIAISFGHVRPNGEICFTAYPKAYGYTTYGENIAYGYSSAEEVFKAWREDNEKYDGQGHRRNMLSDEFTSIGIAHVEYNGIDYWVQEFAAPNSGENLSAPVDGNKNVNIDSGASCQHEKMIIDDAVKATCTTTGLTEGKHCAKCGTVFVEQNIIPVTDHKWDAGIVTVEATCGANGVKIFTCQNCGITKNETIPATGNHKIVIDQEIPATCTNTGLTEGSHCATCDKVIVEQQIIPALNHDWDEGKITDTPTCTTGGTMEYICKRCGETKLVALTENGHSPQVIPGKEATCLESGLTDGSICSVCGAIIKEQEIIPILEEHSWDKGDILVQPTCTEEGIAEYTCTVCGKTKTESINALGHTVEIDEAVAPSYTATGLTQGSHCSVCGIVIKEQLVVPKLEKPANEETISNPQDKPSTDGNNTSDKNTDTSKEENTSDSPKTADPMTLGLLLAAMGASGAGIAGLKKRNK